MTTIRIPLDWNRNATIQGALAIASTYGTAASVVAADLLANLAVQPYGAGTLVLDIEDAQIVLAALALVADHSPSVATVPHSPANRERYLAAYDAVAALVRTAGGRVPPRRASILT